MWEELHKAWDNDARTMWMLNVGDLKPMEIGVDYFARFAWNPTAFGPDSQPAFLRSFAAEHVGDALAPAVADLLTSSLAGSTLLPIRSSTGGGGGGGGGGGSGGGGGGGGGGKA